VASFLVSKKFFACDWSDHWRKFYDLSGHAITQEPQSLREWAAEAVHSVIADSESQNVHLWSKLPSANIRS
jgi:hypothetical protein